MKLKDPRHYGQWHFFIGGKEDAEHPELEVELIRIPRQGHFNSKQRLTREVMGELLSLAAQGAGGYLQSLKEEAASYGKTVSEFLPILIEHQICVRAGGAKSQLCWSTGLGDKVHSVTESVDNLMEKAPKPVKKVYQKIVRIATPRASNPRRLSSCPSCGGGRSFHISRNNRGRSGRF